MKLIWTLVFALFFPLGIGATEAAEDIEPAQAAAAADPAPDPNTELLFLDARETDVRDFIWERRLIVIMADTPDDPQFNRQLDALRDRAMDFVERDGVVIFDAHPADRSPLRQVLRPRGFMTAIIDKDGEVKARRPAVRSARELTAVIDRFPTRRQEVLERLPSGR
ncbi:MAG: DUF4174 domain-containing protein [Roseinatronobacter sp.]